MGKFILYKTGDTCPCCGQPIKMRSKVDLYAFSLMCSRFYCDRRGDRYCCRDCPRVWACSNPCYNDPDAAGWRTRGRSSNRPRSARW